MRVDRHRLEWRCWLRLANPQHWPGPWCGARLLFQAAPNRGGVSRCTTVEFGETGRRDGVAGRLEQFGQLGALLIGQRRRFSKFTFEVVGDFRFGEVAAPIFDLIGIVTTSDAELIAGFYCTRDHAGFLGVREVRHP